MLFSHVLDLHMVRKSTEKSLAAQNLVAQAQSTREVVKRKLGGAYTKLNLAEDRYCRKKSTCLKLMM